MPTFSQHRYSGWLPEITHHEPSFFSVKGEEVFCPNLEALLQHVPDTGAQWPGSECLMRLLSIAGLFAIPASPGWPPQGLCWFSMATIGKHHNWGAEAPQLKCIFSKFWRPEVWNKAISRATFPLEALVEDHSCLFQFLVAPVISWIVASSLRPLPLLSCGLSLCVCVCVLTSYRDTSHRI